MAPDLLDAYKKMNSSAISLKRISKRYGPKEIIHNLSFDVEPGEIVGFLGPNGAGKTTTMKMIAGTSTATSGTVRVAGFDMATQPEEGTKRLGYLPEHPPLYDILKVSGFLNFIANAKGIPRRLRKIELDKVVNACKLENVVESEIYKLSKGYRQRLGLAQALVGDPEVLLLDEPTAGLDPGQIQETREVIRKFGTNHAVLLSTHILTEVTLICSRVAIINQGKLLAIDSPEGLQKALEETSTVGLVTSGNSTSIQEELSNLDNVLSISAKTDKSNRTKITCHVESDDNIESEIARIVIKKGNLFSLNRQSPSLENVFLRYIKESKDLRNTN